jgi:serine/threonine protein kinase
VIGVGGSSTVTVRYDPKTGEKFVVKHVNEYSEEFFINEIESLAKLDHPCVVRILGYSAPTRSNPAEIHMEFAENKSLKDVLEKVRSEIRLGFWNPTGKGIMICGIVLGMRFVHSRGIIHSDLKPSNILVNGEGRALIGDFGASRAIVPDWTPTPTGTVYYAAPEMLEEGENCTTKSDVFQFGLVLYEILVEQPVFDSSQRPFDVLRRLRAMDLPGIPPRCGTCMSHLIRQCWRKSQTDRPSFDAIFRLFQKRQFEIIPGADAQEIRRFCDAVVSWEQDSARANARESP